MIHQRPAVQLSVGVVSFSADAPSGWDALVEQARLLDRCGVDRLVVSEHVAFGTNMDAYARPETGGRAGGRQPTGPDGHWLEPLTALTYLAAHTRRIRLGTNVLLAALRPAAVLAKTAATLDVLSGGRLDLGVGVGWQREEYDVVGLDFDERGRILDDVLEVCQLLWHQQEVSYQSETLHFERIHQMPKPVQPGGVPIWVSGTANKRVARRLARYGSGWIPWGPDAEDPAAGIRRMRDAVEAVDGDPDGFGVVGTLRTLRDTNGRLNIGAMGAQAGTLAAAGVTDVRMSHWPYTGEQAEDELAMLVSAVGAAAGR